LSQTSRRYFSAAAASRGDGAQMKRQMRSRLARQYSIGSVRGSWTVMAVKSFLSVATGVYIDNNIRKPSLFDLLVTRRTEPKLKPCACGCGTLVRSRWATGHHRKVKARAPATGSTWTAAWQHGPRRRRSRSKSRSSLVAVSASGLRRSLRLTLRARSAATAVSRISEGGVAFRRAACGKSVPRDISTLSKWRIRVFCGLAPPPF
jgi:hypothetical protein